MYSENEILSLVRKALSVDSAQGTSIQPFMKEDLEDEAYLQLYSETDKAQMALLKDLPRQQAQQVAHQFTIVDRYGNHRTKAAFAGNALPSSANVEGSRKTVNLKVYGKTTAVQGLTVLQNTIKALGQSNIAETNDLAVRLLLMYQINASLYGEDTRSTVDGNVFKGFYQQIDELTRAPASVGLYTNSDIFVDLRGQKLSPAQIRHSAVGLNKRNATLRRIYMPSEVLEGIENDLDPAARFQIAPQDANRGMIIGNSIDGMRVQGQIVQFRRDNALSTLVRTGAPNDQAIPGAPAAFAFGGSGAGTITQPAVNVSGVGRFATSGERLTGIFYIVTAVNEVGESIASVASALVNATAAKTIEFTITPRGNEQSFRIYRGYNLDNAQPGSFLEPKIRDAQFVFEIPNGSSAGNTAPITVVDSDQFIPGSVTCWGSDVWSPNAQALDQGMPATSRTNEYTEGRSAAAVAQLTGLFEFDLAKLGWLHSNKLLAQVLSPIVPRPFANVIFLNVAPGNGEIQKALIDRP